ncbi:MAG: LacI family DNA-binding transcriptional regulator [Halanaerobiaceae bacterium]
MASIVDVAKKAGVSISTVSRVMNDHPNVSEEKRTAVYKAIDELNYIPNALAQGLVKKTTKSIAILIADITNMFYANLVKSVENIFNKKGYHILIGNTEWDSNKEKEYIKYMLQKQVDGFILASTTLDRIFLDNITEKGLPVMVLDRDINSEKIDRIRIDDYRGGYLAAEHLIKCGYRQLLHISGPAGLASAEDREKGFLQCIKDYNYNIQDVEILPGCYTEECGIQAMEDYLTQNRLKETTGIFSANDAMALGILQVLNERGIYCPQVVGVVGFDNISFARYANPPLTTIKRPMVETGRIAAGTLLERIENSDEDFFTREIKLDVKLVKRSSTIRN